MIVAKDRIHLEQLVNIEVFEKNNLKLENIDVSNVTDFNSLFVNKTFNRHYGSIENWNVSNGRIFYRMFLGCKNLWFDFSNWNMQNAINCSRMFENCYDFEGKGLEHWNLKNVINCSYMFQECHNFDVDVSNWSMENAIDLEFMFEKCYKFRGIGLDKWKIHIKNLEKEYKINEKIIKLSFSMASMFRYCEKLDFDISNWKFETNGFGLFDHIFDGCSNFKGKGLDKIVLKVKKDPLLSSRSLNYLFSDCYTLQVVPKIESEVKTIYADYFKGCYSLRYIGNYKDFEIIKRGSSCNTSNIKLKEYPYTHKKNEISFLKGFLEESNFPNIFPIVSNKYIFTNRRYKIKRNNGKSIIGFPNVKIIDSKVEPKNLRFCTFYKNNEEIKEITYIFYRIKNHNSLSNSPNSICDNFNHNEYNFFNKKNIFLNKNFQNKYFCWR